MPLSQTAPHETSPSPTTLSSPQSLLPYHRRRQHSLTINLFNNITVTSSYDNDQPSSLGYVSLPFRAIVTDGNLRTIALSSNVAITSATLSAPPPPVAPSKPSSYSTISPSLHLATMRNSGVYDAYGLGMEAEDHGEEVAGENSARVECHVAS